MNIEEYFLKLRFDSNHHLGCGDIRLTLGQQDELIAAFQKLRPEAGRYTKEQIIAAYEAGVSSGGGWSDPWKESSVQEERDCFVASLEPQREELK